VLRIKQDHTRSSLAPILKKEDALVDFNRTAREIHNRLRGFQPWPGAYTQFRGKNLKILAAQSASGSVPLSPGELRSGGGKLFAGCGQDTVLELLHVQLEGKKAMSAHDFAVGHQPKPGERLG
jgi:methionyl-tRNA formyltransferase